MVDLNFYKDKRIFLTGHTGFKGSWMCKVLETAGADVYGYALEPETVPDLFSICDAEKSVESTIGDVRDFEKLKASILSFKPEIVIHMAAQPIVRASYDDPLYTYEVNVMGTANIIQAIRCCESVKVFVNVTTDKVYRNMEWHWGYRETDMLGGRDPYSNSKSCSELVTQSFRDSFFGKDKHMAKLACARAGNVIGGGDFAPDRIIPDCIRAARDGKKITVRNKDSIRPWQHVLEPLSGYLQLAKYLYENEIYGADCNFNFGPLDADCIDVGRLTEIFCEKWDGAEWEYRPDDNPVHEASFLKLDCSKAAVILNWRPKWGIETAVQKTVDWAKAYYSKQDVKEVMKSQICEYFSII
ncbi:MAG: CDP-glucose 4,6-dehydratase [Clostridiales bacterium]|nr:CDP-glucose 4,6-dehydratase [Clostridiales bacterium]